MANNKPATIIRDGDIKATLWANDSKNGIFISTTFAKTYDHEGKPKDTNSFSGSDVLRLAEVAREAYRVANRLRRDLNAAAKEVHTEQPASQPKVTEHTL